MHYYYYYFQQQVRMLRIVYYVKIYFREDTNVNVQGRDDNEDSYFVAVR